MKKTDKISIIAYILYWIMIFVTNNDMVFSTLYTIAFILLHQMFWRIIRHNHIEVKIPNWNCEADDVQVTCAKCEKKFCPGCCDKCPSCGYDKVIRDYRWDEEKIELEKFSNDSVIS